MTDEHAFSAELVRGWCALTGDTNPLHLDESWAAGTAFGCAIVPGHLLAARVLDDLAAAGLPTDVSVAFRAPVPVGATVLVDLPPPGRPGRALITLRGADPESPVEPVVPVQITPREGDQW